MVNTVHNIYDLLYDTARSADPVDILNNVINMADNTFSIILMVHKVRDMNTNITHSYF